MTLNEIETALVAGRREQRARKRAASTLVRTDASIFDPSQIETRWDREAAARAATEKPSGGTRLSDIPTRISDAPVIG